MNKKLNIFLSILIFISIGENILLYTNKVDLKNKIHEKTEKNNKLAKSNAALENNVHDLENKLSDLKKHVENFNQVKEKLAKVFNKDFLFKSIKSNDQNNIDIYLALGFDPNVSDENGNTALILACLSKNRTTIEKLLEHGANTEGRDSDGFTVLFHAVKNYPEIVPLLLSYSAKTGAVANYGDTVLMFSCRFSDADTVSLLISAGADVNQSDNSGVTPLVIAAGRANIELVNLLVTAGADINKNNIYDTTALMVAIKKGDYAIVKTLIDAGADVIGSTQSKSLMGGSDSPLTLAIKGGNEKIIALVIESGADPNSKTAGYSPPHTLGALYGGDTSLITAAKAGKSSVVDQMLKAGMAVDAQDNQGKPALTHAVEQKNLDVIKQLIDSGASLTIKDNLGLTPLVWGMTSRDAEIQEYFFQLRRERKLEFPPQVVISASTGKPEMLKRLIDEGANVNVANKDNLTPLMAAAASSEATTQILLSAGANVNVRDSDNKSALIYAIEKHKINNVKLLLGAGAETNVILTATSYAVSNKDNSILTLLIEAGAEMNPPGSYSPLSYAVNTPVGKDEESRIGTMRLLIRAGAEVNHKSPYQDQTPIMSAVAYGHHQAVKFLLDNGADVNARLSFNKTTVLMSAIESNLAKPEDQISTIQILLEAGADISAVDNKGETALMKAMKKNNDLVVKLLHKAEEKK